MLGFAPLAAAPLGAPGAGGVAYDVSFTDAAVVADTALQASPIYLAVLTDAVTGADVAHVTASTFNANMSGTAVGSMTTAAVAAFLSNLSAAATGSDSAAALAAFVSSFTDAAVGADSAQVAASTFNALVSDSADGADSMAVTTAVFNATFSDGITITDADIANFLWNVIDDSQSVTWGAVNTSQSASSWGTIDNNQSVVWTPVKTQA